MNESQPNVTNPSETSVTNSTEDSKQPNPRYAVRKSQIMQFIKALDRLEERNETGKMAALKRAAGYTIAESRNAIGVFYQLIPSGVSTKDEEIYFLVATLRFLNSKSLDGDFGKTMQMIKGKSDSDSISRRANRLIEATFDTFPDGSNGGGEIMYHLRQWVRLAKSKDVGINWALLLEDLLQWTRSDRFIQKKWARNFYILSDTPTTE
jgi:CRISPR system Cascade subunit CasB